MLRSILSLLIVLAALAIGQPANADESYWYYAWDEATSILSAFTTAGEAQTVGEIPKPDITFRLDDQRLLLSVKKPDDTFDLLLVTPTTIKPLVTDREGSYGPVAFHDPFLVMLPLQFYAAATPALLINLDSGEIIEWTTASRAENRTCCTFTPDGNRLRYIARIDSADNPRVANFELRDHDLATGEETMFYTTAVDEQSSAIFLPLFSNDRWLIYKSAGAAQGRQLTYQLVDSSGAVEDLAEFNTTDDEVTFYRPFEGDLLSWQPTCESDCTITLSNPQTGEGQIFNHGDTTNIPVPIYRTAASLVIFEPTDERFLRLHPDSPPEILGYWSPQNLSPDRISPNGRWSIMIDSLDDPTALLIWDFQANAPLHIQPVQSLTFATTALTNDQLVLQHFGKDEFLLTLNTQTGIVTQWPPLEIDRAVIQRIISENQALVFSGGSDALEMGIYRLERETSTLTLLLPGNLRLIDGTKINDLLARQQRL